MIGGPTPVPYDLLFGVEKEVRYGLVCSDIISSTKCCDTTDLTYYIYSPWEQTVPVYLHHSSHSTNPRPQTGNAAQNFLKKFNINCM